MSVENEKQLQILNASAGSGKTYNLVLSYLKLILGSDKSAAIFAQIIAMTFTNKAALEMKTRIIDALDFLSHPIRKSEKETTKAKAYLSDIARNLKTSENETQFRAQKALTAILHQYEDFNVLTIDKFNLRLIRSFSRDLDIPPDSNIILNEDDVLEEVIDQLFARIDPTKNQVLSNLVLRFSKEKLDDEESWNIERELNEFAKIITKEVYFSQLEVLVKNDYSKERYTELKQQLVVIDLEVNERAKSLFTRSEGYDESSLPGKSNTKKAYLKLINDKIWEGNDGNLSFFSESMLKNFEKPAFPADLAQESIQFQDFYAEKLQAYLEVKSLLKNFYNMALLKYIYEELNAVKQTEQFILISEFNKLISNLIKNEHAPFIYEKLGTRFQHFLLDEFQDTSHMQWLNIIPLLHESIANNRMNLIVGDPKQSIYRFKNGLAEQFVALPKIYNPSNDPDLELKSKYFERMGIKNNLEDNWRSHQEIVRFNNEFFTDLSLKLPPYSSAFYADLKQNPKGKAGGGICIESRIEDPDAELRKTEVLHLISGWVEELVKDGYDLGDICILGNKKSECNEWANYLSNLGYKVVSSDSLMVGTDLYVQLCISYFLWRKNPNGEMEARRFSESYFRLKTENTLELVQKYWVQEGTIRFDSARFLRDEFGSSEAFFFPYDNLYSLLQGFYRMAQLNELENPYLHHLSDLLHNFEQTNGPHLDLFIDHFESSGKKEAIQTPENKDAIKIMTGHKSKGLEFPIVLLPNLDWTILSNKANYLIQDKENFYYTSISKSAKFLPIRTFYEEEFHRLFLDKINLTYVLFTRPVERLYIGNLHKKASDKNTLYPTRTGAYFHEIFSEVVQSNAEAISVRRGKFDPKVDEKDTESSEFVSNFIPKNLNDTLWFPDISIQDKKKQDAASLSDEQRFGNQLHALLSVATPDTNNSELIAQSLQDGTVEKEFEPQLIQALTSIFAFEPYRNLFATSSEILSEVDILIGEKDFVRPDKIFRGKESTLVLDFKTGQTQAKYEKQVHYYVHHLQQMGLENVKGIVFYTHNLQFKAVN